MVFILGDDQLIPIARYELSVDVAWSGHTLPGNVSAIGIGPRLSWLTGDFEHFEFELIRGSSRLALTPENADLLEDVFQDNGL